MPQKPEQVLIEQRTSAASHIEGLAIDQETGRHEEARVGEPIHELHDGRDLQRGKASRSRKPVTIIAQTKKGIRIQVRPLARRLMMVAMKFTAPNSEDVMMNTIADSHMVWPVQKTLG